MPLPLALLLFVHTTGADEPPVVTSYADVRGLGNATEELTRRKWIRHRVRYRERISQIAARYGVRRTKLVEWNMLDPQQAYPPKRRRTLKVLTQRIPAARVRVHYVPQEGQTWGDIAATLRVEIPDLKAWNWQRRRPCPDHTLVAWADPGLPSTLRSGGPPADTQPLKVAIAEGATSVGRPHRGRLLGGILLPKSELYTRGKVYALWGSTHALRTLTHAIANFRFDSGYEGAVVIGSISRKHGRRFRPHVSHQSGRDIDIRLPTLPGVPKTSRPNADEVDWYATWSLIHALANTGQVSMIFLEVGLHRRLYEAARVLGVSRAAIAEILSWPSWKAKSPLVRHAAGHDAHMHVRVKCGAAEPRCRSR